jgi:pimeloyl-ACP methyl ester carboxylesterase
MTIRPLLISSLAAAGLLRCQSDQKDGAPMQTQKPEQTLSNSAKRNLADETLVTSKDGTKIASDRTGRGPVLILVSGALSDRRLLAGNPLIPKLAEYFTVYSYDRRGRGESTNTKPYAVEREIEDIDALIAHAGQPVYLFGTSSGGALSMRAAAALGPTKVTKLAVYEVPYGQEPAVHAKQKQGVAKAIETGTPGDAAEVFLTSIGTPPDALKKLKASPQWDAMRQMDFTLNYDYAILGDGAIPTDAIDSISVPTLVMTGEHAMPFMNTSADAIARQLRSSKRKTLAGQTHQVQADVVIPELVAFFEHASS